MSRKPRVLRGGARQAYQGIMRWTALMCLLLAQCECSEPARETSAEPAESVEPVEVPAAQTRQVERDVDIDHDAWARYREHVLEGIRASRAERFAEAIHEFEAALAIEPGAPRALGELGWAAFRAGEMDRAAEATTDALLRSNEPEQRARLLYNLGRIAEQKNMRTEAVASYRESLGLRENETVRGRLLALDPGALDPERVEPYLRVAGPDAFREVHLDEVCEIDESNEFADDECNVLDLGEGLKLIARRSSWQTCYFVALAAGEKWWELEDLRIEYCEGDGPGGIYSSVQDEARRIDDSMWRLDVATSWTDTDWCESYSAEDETTLFCGEQAGQPVCWAILSRRNEFDVGEGRIAWNDATEEELAQCEATAFQVVRDNAPARPARTVAIEERGAQVVLTPTDEAAPARLREPRAIRTLPCLLHAPDEVFACER